MFVNSLSIQGLLNHKERLPRDLKSGLVYSFECDACSATYIGQSMRSLRTRVYEHFGKSVRTEQWLTRPAQSAIRDHIELCGSSRSIDNFKCIRTFKCNVLRRIYESLEIYDKKPSLNQDGSSCPLFCV